MVRKSRIDRENVQPTDCALQDISTLFSR